MRNKRTLVVLRHAGKSGFTASKVAESLTKAYESKKVTCIASSLSDVDPTIRAIEEKFSIDVRRTSVLAGPPHPHTPEKVAEMVDQEQGDIIVLITHDDYAAELPQVLAKHYGLTVVPPIKRLKPGESTLVKVSNHVVVEEETTPRKSPRFAEDAVPA